MLSIIDIVSILEPNQVKISLNGSDSNDVDVNVSDSNDVDVNGSDSNDVDVNVSDSNDVDVDVNVSDSNDVDVNVSELDIVNTTLYELNKLNLKYSENSVPYFILNILTDNQIPNIYTVLDKRYTKNSYIKSLLYCIIPKFRILSNHDSNIYTHEFLKILGYRLENNNLYKKFGYNRSKYYKKSKILTDIFDANYNIDTDTNIIIQKYIVDYFDINVIIFNLDTNIVDNIFSTINKKFIKYKITLLFIRKSVNGYTTYIPLLNNNINEMSSINNIYIFKYSEDMLLRYVCDNLIINN
jgi:hypothetical protein